MLNISKLAEIHLITLKNTHFYTIQQATCTVMGLFDLHLSWPSYYFSRPWYHVWYSMYSQSLCYIAMLWRYLIVAS